MTINNVSTVCLLLASALFVQNIEAQIQIDPNNSKYVVSGGTQPIDTISGQIDYSLMSAHYDSLELIPSQREELDRLIQETGKANYLLNQKLLQAIQSKDQNELTTIKASVAAGIAANQSAMKEGVENTLLPHQLKILNSIAFTQMISKVGISNLASSPIGKTLNLTVEEEKQLRDKAREIEAELRIKIEKLRRAAVNELIQELPQEKRAILEERYSISVEAFPDK